MDQVDVWDFALGFFAGFVSSGVLGFFLQRARQAWAKAGAYRRPQTVMLPTKDTPADVARKSASAAVRFIGWAILLAVTVAVVYMVFRYYSLLR